MKYALSFNILFTTLMIDCAVAQSGTTTYNLADLSRKAQLETSNRTISPVTEEGKKAISFSEAPGDGVTFLKGVSFGNGTIEIDIKGKDVLQQSFVGVAFHAQDQKNLDAVYFRPFNFRSTDPVRHIHAVQYVSHPVYTWDKLRQEKNGQYEKAVTPPPDPNEWFHARIVVHYPHVTVYVNGNLQPDLSIDQLSDRKTGKIGLWVGNNSGGSFANLKITNEK